MALDLVVQVPVTSSFLNHPIVPALPTVAFDALSSMDDVKIRATERVSASAMGLSFIRSLKAFSSHQVLGIGNEVQMRWVDTGAISAEMVGHKAIRYVPTRQQVTVSVGSDGRTALVGPTTNSEQAVSVTVYRAKPKPTSGLIARVASHLRPETIFSRLPAQMVRVWHRRILPHAGLVRNVRKETVRCR